MPSTKKPTTKPTQKQAVPSAKYSIGQKVFFIERSKTKTGEVLQAQVLAIRSLKVPTTSPSGNITGNLVDFYYDVNTCYGDYEELHEVELESTLTAVSLAFTNRFVHLLK